MNNNDLSNEVKEILGDIDKVKKTMRNKKICFAECDSERIKRTFIQVLKYDLMDLCVSLNDWVDGGARMVADERENDA